MSLQALIVILLVSGSSVYAAWTLMPAAARRYISTGLLRLPLPGIVAAPLAKAAAPGTACGCSGCDRAVPAAVIDSEKPLRFHPRAKP